MGAGSYGFKALFTSGNNTKVSDSEGECEPFIIDKGKLTLTTTPHDAAHAAITAAGVPLGSKVHDVAFVSGEIAGYPKANAVTFTFYTDGICSPAAGSSVAKDDPDADGTGVKSVESAALSAGSYSYKASLAGDDNYTVDDATGCEPLTVNKGELHITTTPHDASHVAITSAGVPLGTKVHDVGVRLGRNRRYPEGERSDLRDLF